MKRWYKALRGCGVAILSVAILGSAGCREMEETGEDTGDALEEAGDATMDAVDDAGEEIQDAVD